MNTTPCSRRGFLETVGLGATAFCASCATSPHGNGDKRPNVVLIITDDQGYGDLGATGNPVIRTPHMDSLARDGASMRHFYVSPVCAPTRASLMTGRYNYRTRVVDTFVGRAMMDPGEITVAEMLRDAGYATGIFGKWHLGDCHPMRPQDQGFEEVLVHRGGGIGQPSDPPGGEGKYTDPVLFHNGRMVQETGYCTDVYFSRAMEWIAACRAARRSFFATIATNAPHGPFHDVPQALLEYYRKQDLRNEAFPQRTGHPLPAKCDEDRRARIFAMISNVDDNIGRLLAQLDTLRIADNTIVIFMLDNGPNERRYVAGYRGQKSDVHEGGIRSPFFVRWPAVLRGGTESDRIAAHIDVLPTLLDACGVAPPAAVKLDGRSLLPLLKGENVSWPDRAITIQAHRGDTPVRYHHFALRTQSWKLVHASGFGRESFQGEPKFELYDMEEDPYEMHDLSAERPALVTQLRVEYDRWFDDVSTTRAGNYAPPRIHIGTAAENPVVLTRQDWRHAKGRPWAPDSNGHWELWAAAGGIYDIDVRFPAAAAEGRVVIHVGEEMRMQAIAQGAAQCAFRGISLRQGEARLSCTLEIGDTSMGPWQLDVLLRPRE